MPAKPINPLDGPSHPFPDGEKVLILRHRMLIFGNATLRCAYLALFALFCSESSLALTLNAKNSNTCQLEIVQKNNSDNARKVCQATLLTTGIVAFNPLCLPRYSNRVQKLQVSCLEGSVKRDIDPHDPNLPRDENGHIFMPLGLSFELPLPGSAIIPNTENKSCYFEKDGQKTDLENFNSSEHTLWGSPVMCELYSDDKVVGILSPNGVSLFKNPDILIQSDAKSLNTDFALCTELGNCLQDLVGMPDDLQDKIAILEHMARKNQEESALQAEVANVKLSAEELLGACHDKKVQDELKPKELKQGFWAGFQGSLEEFYLGNFNSNEDLADSVLKDTEGLLKDSDSTRTRVLSWLDDPAQKDKAALDLIKGSAEIVATDVIREKMVDLKLTSQEQQKEAMDKVMPSFRECLANAKNAQTKVKECVDTLQDQAPIVIAEEVLEMQFDKNFRSQFKTAEEAEKAHSLTLASYKRCLADFYLKPENSDLNKEDLARACVYEAMAHAFNVVAGEKIDANLEGLTLTSSAKRELKNNIMTTGLNCQFGATIAKSPNYARDDRRLLSKISTDEFESAVKGCQTKLTTKASDILVPMILSAHPDIQKTFPAENERQRFVDQVIKGPYEDCKKWFESTGKPFSVEVCEGVVRHHAFKEVASRELADKAKSYGVTNHLAVMLAFKACNARIENTLLKETPTPDREAQELSCLKIAVSDLASLAVPVKILAEVKAQPDLIPLEDKIINDPAIKDLPNEMKSCLERGLGSAQNLEEFNSALNTHIDSCTFSTTKGAYREIVPLVLEQELSGQIKDPKRRSDFIARFETEVLAPQIAQMKQGDAPAAFLVNIKKEVMRSVAESELSSLLGEPLKQVKDEETRARIEGEVKEIFLTCVETSDKVEDCPLQVTLNATKLIGSAATGEKIDSFLSGQQATELKVKTSREISSCVDKLESPTEEKASACVGISALNLTATIPQSVLKEYRGALGSPVSSKKFDQEIEKVRAFYEDGKNTRFDNNDPAIVLYASLHTCLVGAREQQRKNTLTLETALEYSDKCSSEFETNIVAQMRQRFTSVARSKHGRSQLSDVFDVLMLFKDAPKPSGAKGGSGSTELTTLMGLLAQMSREACAYDSKSCDVRIAALKKDMREFASRTPPPDQDELKERMIKSKFMDLVIEAQVAKSLKAELNSGLASMKDRTGYLDQSINTITSPQILRSVMETNKGKILLAEVKAKLLVGDTTNITESPRIKAALADALTANTKNNSFIDHLFYGIVEPQIIDQKSSFSGVMGRALGIVKGKNFTWRQIRNTPEGAHARLLFARFFEGVVEGSVKPNDIKGNPRQLKARGLPSEKEITDLLTQGLKRLR